MYAFSIDVGNGSVLKGVAVAMVEIGPLENGEVCENLEEKLAWKLKY